MKQGKTRSEGGTEHSPENFRVEPTPRSSPLLVQSNMGLKATRGKQRPVHMLTDASRIPEATSGKRLSQSRSSKLLVFLSIKDCNMCAYVAEIKCLCLANGFAPQTISPVWLQQLVEGH